jgi:hypothetical protein
MRSPRVFLLCLALVGAACSGSDAPGSGSAANTTATAVTSSAESTDSTDPVDSVDATTTTAPEDAILDTALVCDPLDERACLLPWPNDAFTVPDESSPTGRRLALDASSPPANVDGVPIDVTDINRADGFSPSSAILALVPTLDFTESGIAPSTDIGASLQPDAPIVLLDTTTGERLPYWAELDAQAADDDQRVLMIRPATALPEGHRIVVALRNLRDASGELIAPTEAFLAALDGTPEPLERARAFRELLADLADDDVTTDGLYLAWDFTVASAESLSGRLLSMREQAYAALGDAAPSFTIVDQVDAGPIRTIEGILEVPHFLTGDGAPGSVLLLDDNNMPQLSTEQPTYPAEFRCVLPVAPETPVPVIVYGHGLLGSRAEVDALTFAAVAGATGACATDWIGMSSGDIANVATILGDLSAFNQQADRMLQGHINMQMLGRAINAADGFASSPAFQDESGTPIVAPGQTAFVGNSQGGILGGATSATTNEWSRAVLGVPGANYSLLLTRSSDWPQFQTFFDTAYTDPVDRVLALQLIQLLWDRGENSGYLQHLTANPYDGIEAKDVLMIAAFGDHQVANVSTEYLARSIDAAVYQPYLSPNRSADVEPAWGIRPLDVASNLAAQSVQGGYLVMWDFATPAPPTVNLPPSSPTYGNDPHGAASGEPLVLQQALAFLLSGRFDDVCAGFPCVGAPA